MATDPRERAETELRYIESNPHGIDRHAAIQTVREIVAALSAELAEARARERDDAQAQLARLEEALDLIVDDRHTSIARLRMIARTALTEARVA